MTDLERLLELSNAVVETQEQRLVLAVAEATKALEDFRAHKANRREECFFQTQSILAGFKAQHLGVPL